MLNRRARLAVLAALAPHFNGLFTMRRDKSRR